MIVTRNPLLFSFRAYLLICYYKRPCPLSWYVEMKKHTQELSYFKKRRVCLIISLNCSVS